MSERRTKWRAWLSVFWSARGALAAIGMASIVPQYTDLSRYEYLRAVHSIIVGWNIFAGEIGGFLGHVFKIGDVPPNLINYTIVLFSMVLPVVYSIWKKSPSIPEKMFVLRSDNDLRNMKIIVTLFVLLFVYSLHSLFFDAYVIKEMAVYEIIQVAAAAFLFIVMFIVACIVLPWFRTGFVSVVLFFGVTELLYIANTPYFSDFINNTACEILGVGEEEC